ncbi:hypothetical protein AHFPHNDE_01839 [Pseudomonas sp. MM227]|uniref:class I SAM-dependent methyltransferase n=1 Tax=Pseudomonas sp. MM227 TaxID=3019968 RepID=UPI0022200896|nr:class I SAM-dependent methyltransferase [Pseudomonas sp. MM227]CAI3788166.1 hypothetical protein AHFPHNDE_01839 [Pseudomonas sp. MM227]
MQKFNKLKDLYSNHKGLVSDKWESYLTKYDDLFSSYSKQRINMLEIGVQNGGSLEIWAKYFSMADSIVGCDINPLCADIAFSNGAIRFVPGDINAAETLWAIRKHASTFDIVIDDGSHVSSDIVHTFATLFPLLADNGTYVIEDLHCSYWSRFEGGLTANTSAMAFLKKLVDIVNFEHWGIPGSRQDLLAPFDAAIKLGDDELAQIHSVSFSNSICIIKKKSIENNSLGKRWVVGEIEDVAPSTKANGTYSKPETQSTKTLVD